MASTFDLGDGASRLTPRAIWVGRLLGGAAVLMLALDALMKIFLPQTMIDNSPPLGLPSDQGFYREIGAILLVALVVHLVPRTAILGAVLVTAFLGGAVAINLRVGMPLASNTLFGVYIGVAMWLGLWLRDARVRSLLK